MDRLAVRPGARGLDGHALAFLHGEPELALRVGGAALDDGARHVAVVTGRRVTREKVEDDEFARTEWSAAAVVRIASLFAARDDGVGRQAASVQDGAVDLGAQALAGEDAAAPVEFRAGGRLFCHRRPSRRREPPCPAPCRRR